MVEEVGNDNMTLLCKQKALYVKACVIQNGIADTDNDVLNAEDIKKIFTTFNNQNRFEINHNDLPLEAVSLMENYISKSAETIANTNVPAGSWNCVIRVDNPEIQDKLLSYEFGGVSLNNRVREECALSKGLAGEVTYQQVGDMECMLPILISFVDEPANRVGIEIMDYQAYISKSKKIKTNENVTAFKSDNMNWIEKLKGIIAEAEAEAEEEAADVEATKEADAEVEKADDTTVEKEDTAEAEDEDKEEEEEADVEKADSEAETDSEATEEAEVEKEDAEMNDEDRLVALENRLQILEDKVNEIIGLENPIDEEVVPENAADEPLITKSAKIDAAEVNSIDVSEDFYKATGRDRVTGKRIRNKTRILN